MATSSASTSGSNKFEKSLGNEVLSLEFDVDSSRLSIEVADSSRFVVHRKSITKTEVVQITGALMIFISKSKR